MTEQVYFWLHRVLAEKIQDTKKLQDRISELNHQIQYYKDMADCFKVTVVEDLHKNLCDYGHGWENGVQEICKELEELNKKVK